MPADCRIVLVLLLAALAPLQANAALGGLVSSVEADQIHMHAARKVTAAGAYTVHEITLPSGTAVREFVSSATGQVFAVAWHGPFMPDLKQVLGDQFDTFVQAAGSAGLRRSNVLVNRPGLVVHSGGHMRAFFGKAYLPGQLPAGVHVEDIR
ncbi:MULTISPECIES: DUF2844 domain-containing protein [unclassified Variovorax]|uniref:DUF2844 domain-containing protein n=1 Tax=unclassified Variovorax TaxID=663243 RepID=UPI0013167721|nr:MULTISPECIES: DUF2844 domain-containing protein [unclassified Variovorax]VTU20915.1 hypothetical protein SRS16CHR_02738 [Variovorax sp. SRS16]VTU28830.1 hypothetical protein E5CHR_02688 [Variovorax sp. PBL-E5]